ncbi:unnamed protein product [Symbiodinium sp. KB8]|nr:unnamed protein product [Symbiodinium sp. KB8]
MGTSLRREQAEPTADPEEFQRFREFMQNRDPGGPDEARKTTTTRTTKAERGLEQALRHLGISGWLSGISNMREKFEKMPAKGFIDLTKDEDPVEEENEEADVTMDPPELPPPPLRRASNKVNPQVNYLDLSNLFCIPYLLLDLVIYLSKMKEGAQEMKLLNFLFKPGIPTVTYLLVTTKGNSSESWKRALAKQRQKKESQAKDFHGKDAARLQHAIAKEVSNNLATGAYKLLTVQESEEIRRTKEDKIMESRYVITKKPLEPSDIANAKSEGLLLDDQEHGLCKAKCRHVMKGFSEAAAVEVECTTPQVGRDSDIFIVQVLASMGWVPGFLDFTQAFHSGDRIDRELYCYQPREGVPGAHPRQIIKLLKTCYGLMDGPLAWYRHLARRLQSEFGYKASKADPCVFLLHDNAANQEPVLQGIVGVATDDLLHGGSPAHWANIERIAKEYLLDKNQQGAGRFCGKDIALQPDGSIKIDPEFYVKDKVFKNQVQDVLEGNKMAEEALQHASLGIRVMPIPWRTILTITGRKQRIMHGQPHNTIGNRCRRCPLHQYSLPKPLSILDHEVERLKTGGQDGWLEGWRLEGWRGLALLEGWRFGGLEGCSQSGGLASWRAGGLEAWRLEGWRGLALVGWRAGGLEGWRAALSLAGWQEGAGAGGLEGWSGGLQSVWLEDWRAGEVEGWRAGGREGWRANGRPIAVDRGKIGSKDRCRSGRDGPDLHSITEFRATKGDSIRHEIVEDNWCDSKGIRVLHEKPWTGCTVFRKAMSTDGVVASKIHSSLNQLQQLSSQGGQIIIYHDVALASSGKPALTTIASWKSFRLKRKVVDTLAAEGQSLQAGIGAIHWHRLLFWKLSMA